MVTMLNDARGKIYASPAPLFAKLGRRDVTSEEPLRNAVKEPLHHHQCQ